MAGSRLRFTFYDSVLNNNSSVQWIVSANLVICGLIIVSLFIDHVGNTRTRLDTYGYHKENLEVFYLSHLSHKVGDTKCCWVGNVMPTSKLDAISMQPSELRSHVRNCLSKAPFGSGEGFEDVHALHIRKPEWSDDISTKALARAVDADVNFLTSFIDERIAWWKEIEEEGLYQSAPFVGFRVLSSEYYMVISVVLSILLLWLTILIKTIRVQLQHTFNAVFRELPLRKGDRDSIDIDDFLECERLLGGMSVVYPGNEKRGFVHFVETTILLVVLTCMLQLFFDLDQYFIGWVHDEIPIWSTSVHPSTKWYMSINLLIDAASLTIALVALHHAYRSLRNSRILLILLKWTRRALYPVCFQAVKELLNKSNSDFKLIKCGFDYNRAYFGRRLMPGILITFMLEKDDPNGGPSGEVLLHTIASPVDLRRRLSLFLNLHEQDGMKLSEVDESQKGNNGLLTPIHHRFGSRNLENHQKTYTYKWLDVDSHTAFLKGDRKSVYLNYKKSNNSHHLKGLDELNVAGFFFNELCFGYTGQHLHSGSAYGKAQDATFGLGRGLLSLERRLQDQD